MDESTQCFLSLLIVLLYHLHVSLRTALSFYHGAALRPLFATDASLSGPLPPQGACGFSSAADTNRIRDDILPGWRGLSWSNWDGSRRDAGTEEAPLYVPLMWIFVLRFQQNYNWIDSVEDLVSARCPQSEISFTVIEKISRTFCIVNVQPVFHTFPLATLLESYICEAWSCLFQKHSKHVFISHTCDMYVINFIYKI